MKHLHPELWVSPRPNGVGQQKPNHYGDMAKVAWTNGSTPSTRGTCSPRACATAAPSASPACTTGPSTACTSAPPGCGCSRSTPPTRSTRRCWPTSKPSAASTATELRDLGRLAHPMRRRGASGASAGSSWDEALTRARPTVVRATDARAVRRCTSPAAASPTRPTTWPARRPGPWASPTSTRRRASATPRRRSALKAHDRRGGHDLLAAGRDRRAT